MTCSVEACTSRIADIRAYRRTGHAIVSVTRRGRTHRYRVTLARYYWLRFWLIILCPWRTGGAWMRSSLDVTVSDKPHDGSPEFRCRQWRDFRRRNWARLPRRATERP